eukprot:CAMPEP_0184683260 /NCGR_PEP_ID=MMETSP0312-20130426/10531_1 /TAXON_ID=31354 /ORGANISM="Compsopogon coeruleus, Strain SAG 36.94" /LENGTH=232 /DNA_ID=CAMNT_0027135453 /DNA_START=292 /DNA_END=990 /DNA_ORIENTATION=+
MARFGRTKMLAVVTGTVVVPKVQQPTRGFVDVQVELPPMCSALRFRPGRVSSEAAYLASWIQGLVASAALPVDVDALCIKPGSLVWSLLISICCVEFDGNGEDCAFFASYAALRDTRLPEIQPPDSHEKLATASPMRDKTVHAVDHQVAYPVTFACFDGGETLIDPTCFESDHSCSSLTILIDGKGQSRGVYKPGGAALSESTLKDCEALAVAKRKQLEHSMEIASREGPVT